MFTMQLNCGRKQRQQVKVVSPHGCRSGGSASLPQVMLCRDGELNEQFKGIVSAHEQVPPKGLMTTKRFALEAVFVYQLALLYLFEKGRDLRVGLQPFLRAA